MDGMFQCGDENAPVFAVAVLFLAKTLYLKAFVIFRKSSFPAEQNMTDSIDEKTDNDTYDDY